MTLETKISVNNLVKGLIYRARYRAINQIGSGEFSDISYNRVATVPQAPPTPIITTVDQSKIVL